MIAMWPQQADQKAGDDADPKEDQSPGDDAPHVPPPLLAPFGVGLMVSRCEWFAT